MSKKQPLKRGRKNSVLSDSQLSPVLSNYSGVSNAFDLTPSKYNGGQLDKPSSIDALTPEDLVYNFHLSEKINERPPLKYVVGVDWAELSLRGDLSYLYKLNDIDTYEKKDFKISRNDTRTRHFNHCYNVYYRDILFGTMLCGPRGAVIPVELVQFKIDNQFFYKSLLPLKLSHTITLFLDAFELDFNNFTRLDIYIDFHKFNDDLTFSKFVELYASGQIETKGKISKWNPFYSKKGGKMRLTGFSMGSRSSEKYLRCYNKTEEIYESHKDYIKAFWELNGMDTNKDVYRFELQLSSKFFSSLKIFRDFEDGHGNILSEEALIKLFSLKPSTIIGLFDVGLRNYFDFFIQESRARNDDKIPFDVFDWHVILERIKSTLKSAPCRFVKQRIRHKSFTWRQKMIVARNLFREYIFSKQETRWLNSLAKIIYEYNLFDRWNKRVEHYVKEFMQLSPFAYDYDKKLFESKFAYEVTEIKKELSTGQQLQLIEIPPTPSNMSAIYHRYLLSVGKTIPTTFEKLGVRASKGGQYKKDNSQ
jgi:Replication initiation factor